MEWSREKTVCLIQEYRKRRGLWDLTHEDYRNKDIKHKLLLEVSDCIGGGITITEIEKKFHTLRTQFQREINAMKRRNPYNSKWFAFKHLEFLNSPRACRSAKGRLKNEITAEGTVTTKYIISEFSHDEHIPDTVGPNLLTCGDSSGANIANEDKEYITLQRVATATNNDNGSAIASLSTNRSHELEKLIEETTKDVEDIEDNKSNIALRHLAVSMEKQQPLHQQQQEHQQQQQQQQQQQHHHQHQHHHHTYATADLQMSNTPSGDTQEVHHLQAMSGGIDTININTNGEEEMAYHQVTSSSGAVATSIGVSTVVANNSATMHTIPARIIKIQRRETNQTDSVEPIYDSSHFTHQTHQQTHHGGIQTVLSPNNTTTKRIYYDANGAPHTATILTATATSPGHAASVNGTSLTLLNAAASTPTHCINSSEISSELNSKTNIRQRLLNQGSIINKDEFSIYGDYVASEMRTIKTREVLISLKHKINNAIFEASMQEIQK